MSNRITRFRINVTPGWKKTQAHLAQFCRQAGLPKPRYAMSIEEGAQELANLENITLALREATIPASRKVRFNWLMAYISREIEDLLQLESRPIEEFVFDAKKTGFEFKKSQMIR